MDMLNYYVDHSNPEQPHLGPDAEYLDPITALQWVDTEFSSDVSKVVTATLTRALLGVDPSELSALFLVDFIKSGTGLKNIISDVYDGAQYLRNRQGKRFQTEPGKSRLKVNLKTRKPKLFHKTCSQVEVQ